VSDKASIQDRGEVEENKGKEMGEQEEKIRRSQDRETWVVPRRNIGSQLREAS
jgi:hypothetical protein